MDQKIWEECVQFHGHECPGLAIGVRATLVAMEKLGRKFSAKSDEQVVCITENDACGVDGVQVLSGCTLGKGNLIYRPTGKMAFSFFCRDTGESVRLMLKADATKGKERSESQKFILEAPAEDVFDISKPNYSLPEEARIFGSVACEICGETAPEHKIRIQDGKKVCIDCFQDYSNRW